MAGANTLTFTDSTWDKDVLNSDVPVLVDFWAEWCGPCRMMTPTVDAIATDYVGRIKVGKVNVDENGGTAMSYNIRAEGGRGRQDRRPEDGRSPPEVSVRLQSAGVVTAPSEADDTKATYLAKTPVR